MDCYKALYPKLDFSRVAFYSGLPSVVSLAGPAGITTASGGASPDIRVYIKDYDPCGEETFLTFAHELVHVIQIQGMRGRGHIPGSWMAYYTSQLFNCTRGWGTCSNALEKEAYDFANGSASDDCSVDGEVRNFVKPTASSPMFPAILPCKCGSEPWPIPNPIGAQTYAEALQAAGLVKIKSDVGRSWCSLLFWPLSLIAGAFSIFGFSNLGGAIGALAGAVIGGIIGGWYGAVFGGILFGPLGAVIGAFFGALLGALLGSVIGGAIGWAINEIANWIGGWFSSSSMIWFTAFDGADWVIPDIPVSQNGHSLTSEGPAMALYNGKLFLVYKGKDSNDLWYNTCDGQSPWMATDVEITQNGHSQTDARPALAVYNGKLYLAYKGSGSNDLWYNVFDGASWLSPDLEVTQNGHSLTDAGPALAAYNGKLYLAYKGSGSDDIWYNVFDGASWLATDLKIAQNGHSKTDASPALAVYNGQLYLAYKGSGSNDLWYNVFDGLDWQAQDFKISQNGHSQTDAGPALAVYNGKLYLAYKGSGSDDIWFNTFDGANWLAQDLEVTRNGHVKTGRGPALAAFAPFLFMAYRDNS